jgi:hypothetical protein
MPNLFADTVKTVSLFLLFSLSCATQAQFVIDNFNTNQTLISVSAVGSAGSTQRGTMQGNERDLNVTVTSPGTITAQVRTGVFTYTQDASAVGSADIVWDGIDGNASTLAPSGLGVLNFTASSQNAFMLGVNSCNQSVSVTLTIYSGGGTTKTVTITVPAATLPNFIVIPYNTFSGTGNFTTVGAVTLTVNSSPGANLVIDFLRTYDTTTASLVENYLTDIVLVDNDGNGIASPGDKLRYYIRVKNNDTVPRTNVLLNIATPANTTLGTITATPLSRTDNPSATSSPGQLYHTAQGTTLTVPGLGSSAGLLTNDFQGATGDLATVVSFGAVSYAATSVGETVAAHSAGTAATFGGNSLTVNSDGGLTLIPSSTFIGLISYQYRISNSAGRSDTTASLAVGNRPFP